MVYMFTWISVLFIPSQAAIFMSGNSTFLSVTEQIVRQAISHGAMLLYLVETLASCQAGKIYEKVAVKVSEVVFLTLSSIYVF